MLAVFAQDIRADTPSDKFRGLAHRIAREMRIARRGLDPGVAQEFSDHGQALAQRQGARGEGMPYIILIPDLSTLARMP